LAAVFGALTRRSARIVLAVALVSVLIVAGLLLFERSGSSPAHRFSPIGVDVTTTSAPPGHGQNGPGQNCNDNSQGNNNLQGCRPPSGA
jgi:hypothetical protein